MIGSLLISIVLFLFALLVWKHYVLVKQMEKMPGFKQHFLIGSALEILVDPVELFSMGRKIAQKCQGIYKFIAFNVLILNIYNPEDLEVLISSSKHNAKGFVYNFLRPWLGDGLLLSKGKKWHERRRILTPTFHFNILNQFCVVLGDLTQRLVEGLEEKLDQPIELRPLVSQFTLAATCETAMGTNLKQDDPRWKKYKNAITQISTTLYHRFCKFHLFHDLIFRMSSLWSIQQTALKDLHAFTGGVIKARKEYLKNNNNVKVTNIWRNKHTAMLDLLIAAEDEGLIDNEGIQEEVDTFMFEEKIFEELNVIFGDSTRSASMEDLSNMNYLERCIKESLRLYPPVHFISRTVSEDITLSGHKIRAGTECNIHIYDLHRREDLFPNPELFDPDRFLPENCIGRHPYAYIPFSAGPRNCIGQRFAMLMMKSALSGILRRYRLLPVTKPEDLTPLADIILRNSGPVEVVFTERK